MRFLLSHEHYEEMRSRADHSLDCYVRPGQYLHHLYLDGVKYVVAPALAECLSEAQGPQRRRCRPPPSAASDPVRPTGHPSLARRPQPRRAQNARRPAPADSRKRPPRAGIRRTSPIPPQEVAETGLSSAFLYEMVLRSIYNRGRITGSDLASDLKLSYAVLVPAAAGDAEARVDRHRRPARHTATPASSTKSSRPRAASPSRTRSPRPATSARARSRSTTTSRASPPRRSAT